MVLDLAGRGPAEGVEGYGSHDGSCVLQSEGQEERGPVGAGDPGQAEGTRAPSETACIPFGLCMTLIVWMPG